MVSKAAVIFNSGQENSQVLYLTKQLENLNFSLIDVRTLSSLLASPGELETCLKEFDTTFILGAIGIDLENQICEILAKIFNEKVIVNEKLATLCASHGIASNGAMIRNAKLLKSTSVQEYPVVYVQSLILLAGKMNLLEPSYELVVRPFLANLNQTASFENDVVRKVYSSTYDHIRKAIEIVEDCFTKYTPDNVFMSFNGGKDCTVLLHLVLAVLEKNYSEHKKLFCIYIEHSNSFIELNGFIRECEAHYNIEVLSLTKSIKESLALVLNQKPNMKACLMGTRRTDPFSENLQAFQMTDSDWPQVMRVSPILDWHYSDIWDYLLQLHVPYCTLYDMGYTSLGSTLNTQKNPALLTVVNGVETYLPAFKLFDASKERSGRKT